jgi:uncharacterized protein YgbK (DUF1537 family)
MIVVIADDFTGAAELASIAAQRGWTAEVQTHFDSTCSADVIAIDTNTRRDTPETAADKVRDVALKVSAAKPTWIYKKTDSVLRGNPRSEIEAMLDALQRERCVFVPANPSRRRTIVDGHYFVDGVPLHLTSFAHDPHYPASSSAIRDLLGISNRIRVPDVSQKSDMPFPTKSDLAAGGVDFFATLLGTKSLSLVQTSESFAIEKVLLVCGSLYAWNHHRARDMRQHGFSVFEAEQKIPENMWSFSSRIMLCIGSERSDLALDGLKDLVRRAVHVASAQPKATLLVEGGETVRAFSDAMGWANWHVQNSPYPSVASLIAPNGQRLLVKPGSYAWPDEMWSTDE